MHASDFDRSLAHGIAWTGGMKWLTSLLTWGVTLVVAHLLTPGDYGLVGMAMVFVGIAQLAAESGLIATIIQQPHLSERLAERLGGVAIMLALAIAAISVAAAAPLAAFFNEPAVRWITIALAGTLILRGVQVLRRAMMMRALRFRQIALIDAVDALVTSGSTVTLAWFGFGYWALVGGVLAGLSVSTLCFVLVFPHRVVFPRRVAELEGTLVVGAQVLGGQIAWYASSTADMIVIGRLLGPTALGAYTFAWVLASIAVERVAALASRVTPGVFSAVQHDKHLLRRYVCTFTEGLALLTMPICIGIALVADLIVTVALGDAWLAAIAPMRLLAIYATVRCIAVILPQLMLYTGHARASLKFNIIALVVLVPLFITGALFGGTVGVAAAWVIAFPLLTAFTYLRFVRRDLGLPLAQYLGALRPALGATALMTAAVVLVRSLMPADVPQLPLLLALIATGGLAYALSLALFHRPRLHALYELLRPTALHGALPPTAPASMPADLPQHAAPPRGRLLLISFHFAPDPVIGSLRWQKFARYAADRGWGLDVVMRDEASIKAPDASRLADLPPDVRRIGVAERPFWFDGFEARVARAFRRVVPRPPMVQSVPTDEFGRWFGFRDLARVYFSLVLYFRQRRWASDAAAAASDLVDRKVHRVVIGCGPPNSAYMAARLVADRTGLPLVMDLRDPWSLLRRRPESTASPVAVALDRFEERRTVARAALVVTNSAPFGDAMRKEHPAARIVDIPNGYDDEPLPPRVARKRFIMVYSGTIYFGRDPRVLFRALNRVVLALGLQPDEIGIEFMGAVERVDDVPLDEIAREAGVADFVRLHPTRPRAEALQFLSSASLLVLLPQDTEFAIPAKLYEYMRCDAWILALHDPAGAVGQLLWGSEASVIDPEAEEEIAAVITRRFLQFRAGERGVPLASDQRFSRRSRAADLFGALDIVTGRANAPPATIAQGGRRELTRGSLRDALQETASWPAPAVAAARPRGVPGAGRASDRLPLGHE